MFGTFFIKEISVLLSLRTPHPALPHTSVLMPSIGNPAHLLFVSKGGVRGD